MSDLIRIWRLVPKASLSILFALEVILLASGINGFYQIERILKALKDNVGEAASVTAFFAIAVFIAIVGAAVLSAVFRFLLRIDGVQAEERARDLVSEAKGQLVDYFIKRMESSAEDGEETKPKKKTASKASKTKDRKEPKSTKRTAAKVIEELYDHLHKLTNKPLFDALVYHDQLIQDQRTFEYSLAEADAVKYSWIVAILLPFCFAVIEAQFYVCAVLFLLAVVWIVASRGLYRELIEKAAYLHASWMVNLFSPGEVEREEDYS